MNPLKIDHYLPIQVDTICINQITMRNIDCTYFPLMVKFAPWNIDFHRVFCLVFFIRSCSWFWLWSLLADCSCLSPVVETPICCSGVEPITKAGASFFWCSGGKGDLRWCWRWLLCWNRRRQYRVCMGLLAFIALTGCACSGHLMPRAARSVWHWLWCSDHDRDAAVFSAPLRSAVARNRVFLT